MKEEKDLVTTTETQETVVEKKKSKKDKSHYLSSKEARQRAKESMAQIKKFEAYKRRKNVDESEYLTKMKDDNNVVEFDDLHTYFFTDAGVVKAVDGVTFNIPHGSIVGVIGESGCGKSVTSMSLMQLVQGPTGQIVSGAIRFKGEDYKKDENGNKIPIMTGEIDEKGKPVQLKNEWGVPQFEKCEYVYDIAKMPMSEMRRIRGSQIAMI